MKKWLEGEPSECDGSAWDRLPSLVIAGLLLLFAIPANAQVQFPTQNQNAKVYGAAPMCLDAAGVAQPALYCNAYQNIAANGTTTLKSGKGWFHGVTINKAGAGANTLTIYDNTAGSGTKIATIDTATSVGVNFEYDLQFNTGLTVVMATGTAADITVTWK